MDRNRWVIALCVVCGCTMDATPQGKIRDRFQVAPRHQANVAADGDAGASSDDAVKIGRVAREGRVEPSSLEPGTAGAAGAAEATGDADAMPPATGDGGDGERPWWIVDSKSDAGAQGDGGPCTDSDHDSVCDAIDVCPGHDDRDGCGHPVTLGDTDGDGIPNASDVCPLGPDDDADGNGYADLCDTVIGNIAIPTETKVSASAKIESSASLGNNSFGEVSISSTTLHTGTFSESFDARTGPEASDARYLESTSWACSGAAATSANICAAGLCWRNIDQVVDVRGHHIVRFVVVVDSLTTQHASNGTDITTGGRWEIRGY